MNSKYTLSPLNKTWIFDLDGTIVKHNGYKIDGQDSLLEGAMEFLNNISEDDMIIFITARTSDVEEQTKNFLNENNIRYNHIIFNAAHGERILVNDKKNSGLPTAIAVNTDRDKFLDCDFVIDDTL